MKGVSIFLVESSGIYRAEFGTNKTASSVVHTVVAFTMMHLYHVWRFVLASTTSMGRWKLIRAHAAGNEYRWRVWVETIVLLEFDTGLLRVLLVGRNDTSAAAFIAH